jgi:hypothetical protein
MAAPVGGPGVGIPPTRYGPAPMPFRESASGSALQPRVSQRAGPPDNIVPSTRFDPHGSTIQCAAAAGGGKGGGKPGGGAGDAKVPGGGGKATTGSAAAKAPATAPAQVRYVVPRRRPRARVYHADIAASKLSAERMFRCMAADLHIGNDRDLANALSAGSNVHCLAVWMRAYRKPGGADSNKEWVEHYASLGRVFYLLPRKRVPLDQSLRSTGPMVVDRTESEIAYLVGVHGYTFQANPSRMVPPAGAAAATGGGGATAAAI